MTPKQKQNWLREIAYKGIYLTEAQIQKLENKVELPVVDTPVFLSADEMAVYHSKATLQETKHRVVARTGSYSGGSVRIAKGLSVRTGSSTSRPVYGDVSTHFEGKLVLTNKRLVFLNAQKGFEVAYNAITAATAYTDGISVQSRNHTYERTYSICSWMPDNRFQDAISDAVDEFLGTAPKADIY